MMRWRKINPNPKRRNCGNSPQILERLAWFWSTFLFRRGPRRNVPSFKTHVLNYLSFPFDRLFWQSEMFKESKYLSLWRMKPYCTCMNFTGEGTKDWMVKERPITPVLYSAVVRVKDHRKILFSAEVFIIILGLFALFWLAFTCFDLFWPLLIGFRVATICLRMLRRCRHSSTHCGPRRELLVLPVIVLSNKVVIYLFIYLKLS